MFLYRRTKSNFVKGKQKLQPNSKNTHLSFLLFQSQQVQQKIVDMQGPLQSELTEGVATFLEDVLKFDADYDAFGPMTPGLTAREASDRYVLNH